MSNCSSCNAPVDWVFAASGRRLPLDRAPNEKGNIWLNKYGEAEVVSVIKQAPPHATMRTLHSQTCENSPRNNLN